MYPPSCPRNFSSLPKTAASTRAVFGRTQGSTFGVRAPAKHHDPALFPHPPFSQLLRQQHFLSPNPADFQQQAISSASVCNAESILVKEMSSSSLLPGDSFGTGQTTGAAPMGQGAGTNAALTQHHVQGLGLLVWVCCSLSASWMAKAKAQQHKLLHLGPDPFLIKLQTPRIERPLLDLASGFSDARCTHGWLSILYISSSFQAGVWFLLPGDAEKPE